MRIKREIIFCLYFLNTTNGPFPVNLLLKPQINCNFPELISDTSLINKWNYVLYQLQCIVWFSNNFPGKEDITGDIYCKNFRILYLSTQQKRRKYVNATQLPINTLNELNHEWCFPFGCKLTTVTQVVRPCPGRLLAVKELWFYDCKRVMLINKLINWLGAGKRKHFLCWPSTDLFLPAWSEGHCVPDVSDWLAHSLAS